MRNLELNFSKKNMAIFGLVVIILLTILFLIGNTYGYYQQNLELKDSLEMTVATLSYGLNDEYKVVVPAKGEVRVPIAVMGLNSEETKYQMYYRSGDDLTNVIVGYASYSSNLPSGDLTVGESKQVSLILQNNGDKEVTLFIGVKGGYQNNSVEDILLGNGEIRITNRIESEEVTEDMATPEDILSGKKAWVDGNQITGTMVNRGTVNQTLKAGESYTIPEGYHDGKGVINSDSLASQTQGTATAEDIRNGKTAWVNGVETTGTATEFTNTIFIPALYGASVKGADQHYAGGGGIELQNVSKISIENLVISGESNWPGASNFTITGKSGETSTRVAFFTDRINVSDLSYDVSMYDSVTIYAYSYNGTQVRATNLRIELK